MSFRQEVSREVKWRERRRGNRVNSSVPVAIEWKQGEDRDARVEAKTRILSPYGCLVVLPQEFALNQRVRVTNLATQQQADASIVWKGNHRVEGWEWGIELSNPGLDFWGMEL